MKINDDYSIMKVSIQSKIDINESMFEWHNSANYLCNFMRERKYLYNAITNMALFPRYNTEIIDYLNNLTFRKISFPMLCFCDIPLTKVSSHMNRYGMFGIALKKRNCIIRDVQPIQYINRKSRLCKDMADAFAKANEFEQNNIGIQESIMSDMFLSHLLYVKPIDGFMERNNSEEKVLFQDECEWRFIPELPDDMPLILPEAYTNPKGNEHFSSALDEYKSTRYNFELDDIAYIIVPSEHECELLISKIISDSNSKKLNENSLKLISKIEIADYFDKNLR